MAFVPDSKVRLLNVPLDKEYKNQIYFANTEAQFNYFKEKVVHTFSDFTYVRKEKQLRIPKHIDELYNCNYVMYQNSHYSNKWFYAFITKMEYITDECTYVYIETDVWQTWFSNIKILDSFVEREHVVDDTFGLHTVPENLEMGEYICNSVAIDTGLQDFLYFINVTETVDVENGGASDNRPLAMNLGGVYMAGGAYVTDINGLVNILVMYDGAGIGDAIQNVYVVPKSIVTLEDGVLKYPGQMTPGNYTFSTAMNLELNGYTPKNKKLLCFPYNYLNVSNNNGISNILHYEKFDPEYALMFKISGIPTPGCSIKCVPRKYNGIDFNEEEGIMAGKFPTCSWSQDLYTNWLVQNGVNISLGIASDVISLAGGLVLAGTGVGTGIGAMGVVNGAMGISQTLGQVYQHSLTPATAKGNVNGGDINTANKTNCFHFYKMSIKKEYAEIIDKYFDMYGYKINKVKEIKLNTRPYWNYIKTIGVNIKGAIPTDDMEKIKNMFDKGVTFWKNGDNIGNYSLNNH